ncbi:MAG: TIGR00725 family protein [Deltaproteobacteria bacterium]|nr:TIGR00725 family protein [Deltaproteobacteria bacterium]
MSASHRRPQVTVIGNYDAQGGSAEAAELVGQLLGKLRCTVISGGGKGIMLAVSRGARQAGALTIGILPGADMAWGNGELDVVIPSGIGYARNLTNVLAADLVIAIGGGSGTLNEMAFAWMHNKPMVALTGFGGWADRLAGQCIDDRRTECVERADSLDQLEQIVRARLGKLGFRVD